MRCATALAVPCAIGALLGACAVAGAFPLEKALDYLSARQDPPTGAVGPEPGRAADTAWASMAVAGAGEAPAGWSRGGATLAAATSALPAESVGDLLRVAVARAAAGTLDDALAARVAAQQSADGTFGAGAVSTAWGVLALRAVGRSPGDAAVVAAVQALVGLRTPDGGWASVAGAAQSDAVATASGIQALRAGGVAVSDPVLVNARARLLALRDATGGFSRSAVPTAWAVLAIRALGEQPGRGAWARGGSPLGVLDALQDADGGVRPVPGSRPSVFATAVSALAWSARVLPLATGSARTPDRAPRVVSRTPASGDMVRGVLSVRYTDERGGTGVDPRRTRISVNGVDITRRARVTPFTLQVRQGALPAGNLAISVRVRDRAGHSSTSSWSVMGPG